MVIWVDSIAMVMSDSIIRFIDMGGFCELECRCVKDMKLMNKAVCVI